MLSFVYPTMTARKLLAPAFLACAAFAQTAPPRLDFEVASIKPSPALTDSAHIGMRVDGSQVYFSSFSLKDYIRIAYRVKDYQVEVPDWMSTTRFDIAAKLPAGATREQVYDMLQSLLLDRFKLQFHRLKKEFPVYALVVAKGGAKLTPSNLDGVSAGALTKPPDSVAASGSAAGVSIDLGQGASFSLTPEKLEARRLTTARLAEFLSRFVDRPVVDMTNLQGAYDLDLKISPEDYRGMLIRSAMAAGVALPPEAESLAMTDIGDSLATGLLASGLRLESRKAPLDVIVVDHAEREPTDN